MNRIRRIDLDRRVAVVEPGVTSLQLNQALQKSGLMFAPEPSTRNRCTIGGMFGNNSWGLNAVRDGTPRHELLKNRFPRYGSSGARVCR